MTAKRKTKEKLWLLRSQKTPEVQRAIEEIANDLGVDPILANLLYNRGYQTPKDAKAFLYMESEMLSSPFLMKDMDRAVARIRTAVCNHEKITVYGDYDVDGVTAVCVIWLYLKKIGANVDYYIPNRIGEGYGVSVGAIDAIAETGTTLIITVDTGITANEEVEYAKTRGIDFVITDHHECHSDLPNACAMVNPHRLDCPYPFKDLAGVGVVFKVVCAYEERITGKKTTEVALDLFANYADLVAIGTIADVMPIACENRLIVSYGLRMMQKQPRVGLAALMDAAIGDGKNDRRKHRPKITTTYIGFTIAPKINAAGRIRSASRAVDLFLAERYSDALEIAKELCEANKERQNEENRIMQEAFALIEERGYGEMPVIVLEADHWHHGVIGIVSSRITEHFYRPSILISFEGNMGDAPSLEDVGKGSGRSIKGLNLVEALCDSSDHLIKFGGHELAAGLSVKRGEVTAFREKINAYAEKAFENCDLTPIVDADCEIAFDDINCYLAEHLSLLEPYGTSNPVPTFILRNAAISAISGISNGKHTKLTLTNGHTDVSAMYFSKNPAEVGASVGDRVDILFQMDVNEWQGRKSVQMIVRDLKLSSEQLSKEEDYRKRYEEIRNGGVFYASENILPCREDFAAVYRLIHSAVRSGTVSLTHKEMLCRLSASRQNVGYLKLKMILKIFLEMNILSMEETEEDCYRFSIRYSSEKADLEKSGILRRLRSQMKTEESTACPSV